MSNLIVSWSGVGVTPGKRGNRFDVEFTRWAGCRRTVGRAGKADRGQHHRVRLHAAHPGRRQERDDRGPRATPGDEVAGGRAQRGAEAPSPKASPRQALAAIHRRDCDPRDRRPHLRRDRRREAPGGCVMADNPRGRPRKLQPDEKTLVLVKGLGNIQATGPECAAVLGVTEPTWIKFKKGFPEVEA